MSSRIVNDSIQSILGNYLRNYLHTGTTNIGTRQTSTRGRNINEILEDISDDYNHNIHEYNRNMSTILSLLRADGANVAPSIPINPAGIFMNASTSNSNANRQNFRNDVARLTMTYGFTEDMISENPTNDPNANLCPITLESFEIGDVICEIRGCNHKFKRPALMNWLRRNDRCPVCRYNLFNPEVDTSGNIPAPPTETVSDPSGNIGSANNVRPAFMQIIQNIMQNPNIESLLDGSGNLLYEFEFPIYNFSSGEDIPDQGGVE